MKRGQGETVVSSKERECHKTGSSTEQALYLVAMLLTSLTDGKPRRTPLMTKDNRRRFLQYAGPRALNVETSTLILPWTQTGRQCSQPFWKDSVIGMSLCFLPGNVTLL